MKLPSLEGELEKEKEKGKGQVSPKSFQSNVDLHHSSVTLTQNSSPPSSVHAFCYLCGANQHIVIKTCHVFHLHGHPGVTLSSSSNPSLVGVINSTSLHDITVSLIIFFFHSLTFKKIK